MKILFVCTGNTCRSPMAEGMFRKMAAGRLPVECASAGIAAVPGQEASPYAVEACREIGVDISGHRARKLIGGDMTHWDIFFTMSPTHGYILERAGVPAQSIYAPQRIEDPFGQGLEEYRQCRDRLGQELTVFYRDVVTPWLAAKGEASGWK